MTNLVSSNFESFSGTEFLKISQNIQQTDETSSKKTLKQNGIESSSGELVKGNVSCEKLSNM